LAILLFPATWVAGQPAGPPAPAKYFVKLRYIINAPRDPHVEQYDAMIRHLQSLNFEFIPPLDQHAETDREDPSKNRLEGLVPADKVLDLLKNKSVASVLLLPVEVKDKELPAEQPVGVRLELAGGLSLARQKELADQARVLLGLLGFKEAVAYDHRGLGGKPFTRLVGTIPAGRLESLLKDLRGQPEGWFAPRLSHADLPAPLRNVNPIPITEVLPGFQPSAEPAGIPPRAHPDLDKLSPELFALLNAKGQETLPVRIQVVLDHVPQRENWRPRLLQAAPRFFIEGRLGNTVTGFVPVGQVRNLAALRDVSVLRLTSPARVEVDPKIAIKGDNARALKQSGLAELHKKDKRGQGIRLAIIDSDFRGYQDLIKTKQLPAKTRLVDLTRERNPSLFPTPYRDDGKKIGHGTQCALAAALAAPDVELVLIRVPDPDPVDLVQVIRLIRGQILSAHLVHREDELISARAEVLHERDIVLKERNSVLEDFTDDLANEHEFGFLGPVRGWLFSPREWHRQRMAHQEKLEKTLAAREARFRMLMADLRSLEGIDIVANALVWNHSYPLGATSPLSRWLNEAPGKKPLWFQAAGNTGGQTWSGLFRDEDGNGVMEFAPAGAKLPKERWTSELNFLGWQPFGKPGVKVGEPAVLATGTRLELPAGAKIRILLQWREAHDPDYAPRPGEQDLFRKPLTEMRLVLLRQRDPEGKKEGADGLNVVARSGHAPLRLANHPTYSVYEQELEYTVDKPGRFALRVERQIDSRWVLALDPKSGAPGLVKLTGLIPTGIRPKGAASLPALEKTSEIHPRLFIEFTDPNWRGKGRPVFLDYATELGNIGTPADAREAIVIAAADLTDKAQLHSSAGQPADLELFPRPILAYDTLDLGPDSGGAYGSSLANSFAAGLAASLLSSGMSREQLVHYLHRQAGKVLRVPAP
jgi:hypothetical protein